MKGDGSGSNYSALSQNTPRESPPLVKPRAICPGTKPGSMSMVRSYLVTLTVEIAQVTSFAPHSMKSGMARSIDAFAVDTRQRGWTGTVTGAE